MWFKCQSTTLTIMLAETKYTTRLLIQGISGTARSSKELLQMSFHMPNKAMSKKNLNKLWTTLILFSHPTNTTILFQFLILHSMERISRLGFQCVINFIQWNPQLTSKERTMTIGSFTKRVCLLHRISLTITKTTLSLATSLPSFLDSMNQTIETEKLIIGTITDKKCLLSMLVTTKIKKLSSGII